MDSVVTFSLLREKEIKVTSQKRGFAFPIFVRGLFFCLLVRGLFLVSWLVEVGLFTYLVRFCIFVCSFFRQFLPVEGQLKTRQTENDLILQLMTEIARQGSQ